MIVSTHRTRPHFPCKPACSSVSHKLSNRRAMVSFLQSQPPREKLRRQTNKNKPTKERKGAFFLISKLACSRLSDSRNGKITERTRAKRKGRSPSLSPRDFFHAGLPEMRGVFLFQKVLHLLAFARGKETVTSDCYTGSMGYPNSSCLYELNFPSYEKTSGSQGNIIKDKKTSVCVVRF